MNLEQLKEYYNFSEKIDEVVTGTLEIRKTPKEYGIMSVGKGKHTLHYLVQSEDLPKTVESHSSMTVTGNIRKLTYPIRTIDGCDAPIGKFFNGVAFEVVKKP